MNHNLFSEFAEFSTRRKDGPFDAVAAFARAAQVFVLIAGLLGAGAAAYGKHLDQSGTTEVDAKVVKFPSGYLK